MKKIQKFLRKNYLIVIAILITIFFVGKAFYVYFDEYYSYANNYYEMQEECTKTKDEEACLIVEHVQDPKEKFATEETRDLYFKIVCHNLDIYIVAPLIIFLIVMGVHHTDFSSGNIKNYLTRQSLKDYRRKMFKTTYKAALVFPLVLLTIAILCAFITNFNFTITESIKAQAQYDAWNYNNFGLYLIIHCAIIYLIGVLYGNLSLMFLNKSKNKILVILFSYIAFFALALLLYVLLYAIILTNLLNINISGQYFNLLGSWQLYTKYENYYLTLLSTIIYTFITTIIVHKLYSSKEKVLILNDKEKI